MKQAIVIATTPSPSDFLPNLLRSMEGYDKYPILVVSDYGYELGKIKFIYEHTDIEEFFLLQESCEIKDTKLFDMVFEKYKGKSVSVSPHLQSYLVKYRRAILDKMEIPVVKSKIESIEQEYEFNKQYKEKDSSLNILFPDLGDKDVFEEKFGRTNMVIENKYIKKYKGTWTTQNLK